MFELALQLRLALLDTPFTLLQLLHVVRAPHLGLAALPGHFRLKRLEITLAILEFERILLLELVLDLQFVIVQHDLDILPDLLLAPHDFFFDLHLVLLAQ